MRSVRMFRIAVYLSIACILPTMSSAGEVAGLSNYMYMSDSTGTASVQQQSATTFLRMKWSRNDTSLQITQSAVGSRSVRLNTYNNYHFSNDDGWSTSQMYEVLARKNDVMVTESWPLSAPTSIKALNPAVSTYCYYALSIKPGFDVDGPLNGCSHQQCPLSTAMIDANDWWLRDGNGEKVGESGNTYFLDVGKYGFKEAYLSALLSRLSGRGLDGVILDYWTPGLATGYLGSYMQGRPFPTAYPTDQDWYTKAWQPFVSYVCTGLRQAGYRIIGNCVGEYDSGSAKCDWQRMFVDGSIYEQWAVNWPGSSSPWLPGSTIDARINHMANDPLEVWTADYGLRTSDPLYDQEQKVGLAMYYIAIPMTQSFRSYNQYEDSNVYWDSIWDFQIGVPAAPYVKMAGEYFWSRKFTQGLVLLNYESSQSIRYTLDRTYRDSDGNTFNRTIQVPPHTGVILAVSN